MTNTSTIKVIPNGDLWTISGQSLWYFLGGNGHFKDWFNKIVKAGGYVKNEDYYDIPRLKRLSEEQRPLYIHDDLFTVPMALAVLSVVGTTAALDAAGYVKKYQSVPVPDLLYRPKKGETLLDSAKLFLEDVIANNGMDPTNHFKVIKDLALLGQPEPLKKPMERFYELIYGPVNHPMDDSYNWTTSEIAMNMGTDERELNRYLERYGIQKMVNGHWELTEGNRTTMKVGDKWTPIGQYSIFKACLDHGWRPNIKIDLDVPQFCFEIMYWLTKEGKLSPKYQAAKNEGATQN